MFPALNLGIASRRIIEFSLGCLISCRSYKRFSCWPQTANRPTNRLPAIVAPPNEQWLHIRCYHVEIASAIGNFHLASYKLAIVKRAIFLSIYEQLVTDIMMLVPTVEFVDFFARANTPVYMYSFDHYRDPTVKKCLIVTFCTDHCSGIKLDANCATVDVFSSELLVKSRPFKYDIVIITQCNVFIWCQKVLT